MEHIGKQLQSWIYPPNQTERNETKRKMWTIQTNDTKMEHEKKNRGEKQMASRANRIS